MNLNAFTIIEITVAVNALVFGTVSFYLKSLVRKIDDTAIIVTTIKIDNAQKLGKLDKDIAVLNEKITSQQKDISRIEKCSAIGHCGDTSHQI